MGFPAILKHFYKTFVISLKIADMDKVLKVFVVEDDVWYAELLKHQIELNPSNQVEIFERGKELLKNIGSNPDLIIMDYNLPDISGLKLFNTIKNECLNTEVVVVSGQNNISIALDLIKDGAYDYIVKNDETKERLWQILNNISKKNELKKEIEELRNEVEKKYTFSSTIIGNSPKIKSVFSLLEKATKAKITVSITGETGTGKEVVAKSIHFNSSNSKSPFIPINVSAIPNELIESELFGYEKGAFTGANNRKIGKFELAKDGTIFLDEIAEMDLNMQSKLLRVIQEREVVRLGGNDSIKINCRIIVATHKDLKEEVNKGNFREDLYYRLFGLPIHLPPLRDRGDDVLLLSKYFIEQFSKENNLKPKKLSESAIKKIKSHPFPGNVRELKAVIDLAMVLSDEDNINSADITFATNDPLQNLSFENKSLKDFNDMIIMHFFKNNDTFLKD